MRSIILFLLPLFILASKFSYCENLEEMPSEIWNDYKKVDSIYNSFIAERNIDLIQIEKLKKDVLKRDIYLGNIEENVNSTKLKKLYRKLMRLNEDLYIDTILLLEFVKSESEIKNDNFYEHHSKLLKSITEFFSL